MKLVAKESKITTKQRERSESLAVGFETAMFFQAFEENLTGILTNVKAIREGTMTEPYVEEATYRRYVEAKNTLKQMAVQIETFQTMLQIVEYDLLETTGT
jgi:hypothetical protein